MPQITANILDIQCKTFPIPLTVFKAERNILFLMQKAANTKLMFINTTQNN